MRTLGRTGLPVSEIGFGCGPTGGLMIRGSAADRREAVACALDLGINYFDTAPGYGPSVSESHLGETLQELGAQVVIATKVALDWSDLGDIAGSVQRSVEQSLKRLRQSEVALIQLHNRVGLERAPKAPFGTGALLASADVSGPGGVLEAFERLRERGLVRYFGCSAFGGDMPTIGHLIDGGRVDVLSVHYSILNATAWRGCAGTEVLDYSNIGKRAAAEHLGVVALRVLEGGALTTAARGAGLSSTLHSKGIEPAEAAVRFVLSNPQISTALIGFSNLEQIRKAADYSRLGPLVGDILKTAEGE